MEKKTDIEKIREVRNAYHRKYRKEHPDIIKKNQNDYWLRKAKDKTKKEDKQNDKSMGRKMPL